MGTCHLCGTESEELKHLPLYVSGSEGISACLICRLVLTEVASGLKHAAGVARIQGWKNAKSSAKRLAPSGTAS